MGEYTSHHGVAAAARFFTRKLGHQVSETTVHSMKKAYLQEMKRKRANEEDDNIALLPHQKRGRPLLLGENLDHKAQLYVKRVSSGWRWGSNSANRHAYLLQEAFSCPAIV